MRVTLGCLAPDVLSDNLLTEPQKHLAELNIGRLVAPTSDTRVQEFMDNLDFVNGAGRRMPGFVWMMEGSGEPGTGNVENHIGADPQLVANLTVWKDIESLKKFVFGPIHRRFMERRQEWFEVLQDQHFAMWWVPADQKPSLEEALQRLEIRREGGDSEKAFGWDYIKAL